ncbi:hypothetical protein BJ875DRAFT_94398 [Amylocarpus encephaloides]|uniref:Ilp is an apoptosis inhibitor n=1 Tax=Amylocarpus encephaloides TaxID=45428 RepID=A0A9P7YEY8_9HELO|nr:hypothetical protein BJ875DRAFT_94398 [Amylocarpus encephaloides]
MAFNQASPSNQGVHAAASFPNQGSPSAMDHRATNPPFEILEWYPQFQSCHRYFLDVAQHTGPVQALAAFVNIQLPFQKEPDPIVSSTVPSPRPAGPERARHLGGPNPLDRNHHSPYSHPATVPLIPYIRRLVATGHDSPGVLHGLFGDDWVAGIGSLHQVERRNYLFAAKSTSWLKVKQAYDMSPQETVPFLRPLSNVTEKEIQAAESTWSEWLAMQDWMLGPRAPESRKHEDPSPRVQRQPHP